MQRPFQPLEPVEPVIEVPPLARRDNLPQRIVSARPVIQGAKTCFFVIDMILRVTFLPFFAFCVARRLINHEPMFDMDHFKLMAFVFALVSFGYFRCFPFCTFVNRDSTSFVFVIAAMVLYINFRKTDNIQPLPSQSDEILYQVCKVLYLCFVQMNMILLFSVVLILIIITIGGMIRRKNEERRANLERELMENFPQEVGVVLPEGSSCSVCFEPMTRDELLSKLPLCGHYFHTRCIQPWVNIKQVCPLCQRELF